MPTQGGRRALPERGWALSSFSIRKPLCSHTDGSRSLSWALPIDQAPCRALSLSQQPWCEGYKWPLLVGEEVALDKERPGPSTMLAANNGADSRPSGSKPQSSIFNHRAAASLQVFPQHPEDHHSYCWPNSRVSLEKTPLTFLYLTPAAPVSHLHRELLSTFWSLWRLVITFNEVAAGKSPFLGLAKWKSERWFLSSFFWPLRVRASRRQPPGRLEAAARAGTFPALLILPCVIANSVKKSLGAITEIK